MANTPNDPTTNGLSDIVSDIGTPFPKSPATAAASTEAQKVSRGASTAADKVTTVASDAAGKVGTVATDAAAKVGTVASDAAAKLSQGVTAAAEKIGPAVDRVVQTKDEWMQQSRSQIQMYPFYAIGAAFLAGMLFSRLTRD